MSDGDQFTGTMMTVWDTPFGRNLSPSSGGPTEASIRVAGGVEGVFGVRVGVGVGVAVGVGVNVGVGVGDGVAVAVGVCVAVGDGGVGDDVALLAAVAGAVAVAGLRAAVTVDDPLI